MRRIGCWSRPRLWSRAKVRGTLIRGDLAADRVSWQWLQRAYAEIARAFPAMLGDILPRLLRTIPESGLESAAERGYRYA